MKKTIYRTVIKLEVLSDDPIPAGMTLGNIIEESIEGEFSTASEITVDNKPISGKKAVNHILNQGSDTSFFGMDDNGNETDEY